MPLRDKGFDLLIARNTLIHRARVSVADAIHSHPKTTDIFLCVVDHFEPSHGRADRNTARKRLDDWLIRYPQIASRFHDCEGRIPHHSFFYPWDEFDSQEFRDITEMCHNGCGEVELHLHHQNDSDETLRPKIREALREYRKYGCLSQWPDGRTAFGFIHGNWALDNSRCKATHNYCGVNNEITVLQEEGCFADFTFPAWQHTAQPRQVNSIYYAIDDPLKPKSYDRGHPARVGPQQDGLLLIQGPLVPYIESRFGRVRFAVDDGDLAASKERRYAPERLDRWVKAGIRVKGRPDRVFVKVHCHGAPDANREALLGRDLEYLFSDAQARYNDGKRFRLHYVTARQMFNVINATQDGVADSEQLVDWKLPPPWKEEGDPFRWKIEESAPAR